MDDPLKDDDDGKLFASASQPATSAPKNDKDDKDDAVTVMPVIFTLKNSLNCTFFVLLNANNIQKVFPMKELMPM